MNVAIDYSTVKWVKHELDATLKQARQALEAYVENPADETQLRFCAVHLHQVYGTLQMVELYGAALLAEEMEQVVQALLDATVVQKQDAYELIMRAILQLPDYLERLVSGGRDLPLVLLPLLNDLRAIRGQKLLSENALFSPDLGLPLPASARRETQHTNAAAVARKQRHAYQVALLGWFRGQDVDVNLTRIEEALTQLQGICADDAAQKLWWIAGGLVNALKEEWLETSIATKLLLGQVDRQIKRLMDDGEQALAANPPADLLKNLLFYIARAKDGGAQVTLIKQTYRLSTLLPDDEELARAQDSLTGHNVELMRTVGAAIKEDLLRVKDVLDLFLRGGRKATADLQSATDTLARVADTLGMLGQGSLRKRVQEQTQSVADMVAGRREADEAALMEIASALLYVESSVEGLAQGEATVEPGAPEDADAQSSGMTLPESEFNQVRGVVADEAIRDIAQAKDSILAFIENSTDYTVLEKVPALFNQIKGGLLLLNEQRAAEVVEAVRGYVAVQMLGQQQAPAENTLDDLADVISSVEYYLENLRDGRKFGQTILVIAENSVARLRGVPVQAETAAPDRDDFTTANVPTDDPLPETAAVSEGAARAADDLATVDVNPVDAIELDTADISLTDAFSAEAAEDAFAVGDRLEISAAANEDLKLELSAGEDAFAALTPDEDPFTLSRNDELAFEPTELVVEEIAVGLDALTRDAGDAFSGLVRGLLENGSEIAMAAEAVTEPATSATPAVAVMPVVAAEPELPVISDDIDDEILEIFIEEADEELAKLRDVLPRWVADADDREALTDMRRSFHTLKGSGRLVGALRIGEFAWGFESMLNRLIDGTVERSDAFCALLEHAAQALPELVEQIRSRGPTTQPIERLTQLAHAMSRGESVDLGLLGVATESDLDAVIPDEPVAEVLIVDSAAVDFSTGFDDLQLTAEVDDFAVFAAAAAEAADAFGSVDDNETVLDEPAIDPVLYDIFCNESADHLAVIREFISSCESLGRECRVNDDLMRALHTLHGSARMVGADAIAEIAYEIEKYGKALRNDQRPMSQDGMQLMARAAQLIEAILPQLREPGEVHAPYLDLVEAIARLPRTTENVEHIPSAEVPQEQDEFDLPSVPEIAASAVADDDAYAAADADLLAPFTVGEAADAFAESLDEPLAEVAAAATTEDFMAEIDLGEPEIFSLADFAVPQKDDFTDAAMAEHAPGAFAQATTGEIPAATQSVMSAAAAVAGAAVPMAVGDDWVDVDYSEVDADLLDVFLEEGDEIIGAIDTTLQAWIQAPEDQALTAELQRHLHTLKGGARMANLTAIGDLSHAVESLLIAVVDGQVVASQVLFDTLLVVQDRVVHMLEAARAQQPMHAAHALVGRLEALRHGVALAEMPMLETSAAAPVGNAAAAAIVTVAPVEEVEAAAAVEDAQKSVGRTQQELVRVRADLLDSMVNFAGEISIYRSRMEQQVGSMRFNLGELGQTVTRLRDQLRQIEIETEAQVLFRYERDGAAADDQFDPLEMDRYSHLQQLSRSMLEGIGDLVSIQGLLDNITRESETLLLQQARVNTELQEGLMRTRMVPFSGLAPRMRRIVRQACQELGKRAELTLEGAEGEMDRTVIDRIIAPIEHMLRNALAHGIESPERRAAAGKRESGSIKVSLSRDGSEVVIRMVDDGAGMNIAAIRRKALERGLITDTTEISDHDVMQFILETGFSTAEQVSQISGRGVGMDVVNSEVKQLGGSLYIDSVPGQGTTFTIRLPFTLAISQALLVQVHEEVYAIPLTGIEGIVRMTQAELAGYLGDPSARFDYAGHSYPVHNLGALLGQGSPVYASKRLPVLLVRSGEHRMALQVEALLGSRETVVKSVGPQISTVRGISGATILGDGRVVLILDLGGLLRTGGVVVHGERAPIMDIPLTRTLTVMVVDDSITVRKVTTRLLERNDMQVITAKDGVDAVAKLQEHIPDVMLLDIEMPRMDGFELAIHVRNEPRLRGIPIIIITSRTGDKHRKRAMEIGVDRYLGKPYQESELLDTIRHLTEERRANG